MATSKLVFSVMDHTGHSSYEFDKLNPEDLARGQRMFDELVKGQGMIAATRAPNGDQTLVKSFNPNAEETVFHRQLGGG